MPGVFVFVGGPSVVQDGGVGLSTSEADVQLDAPSASVQLTSTEAVVQLDTTGKPPL